MASFVFNSALKKIVEQDIDLTAVTVKCMLVNGYSPDKDTHDFRDDVTDEASGDGYTSGGATVDVTITPDNATDSLEIEFDAAQWNPSSVEATGAVYYVARGGASSADELLAYNDFGGALESVNAPFGVGASTITFDNSGA